MILPVALIAEDEPLLRGEIRSCLSHLWPELRICCEATNGAEAIEALERHSPQILFLDIQMPGVNGLEVARHASGRAHVVFISAFDQFAVEAFERGAIDYVLKPLNVSRLQVTVARLQERLSKPPAELEGILKLLRNLQSDDRDRKYLKWLTVPDGSDLRIVTTSEILYLRADNKYTEVITATGTFLLNSTLKHLREKLDPEAFWQIHRSVIVNVAAIDTIYRSFKGTLELKIKAREELLPVSAAHAHLFRPP